MGEGFRPRMKWTEPYGSGTRSQTQYRTPDRLPILEEMVGLIADHRNFLRVPENIRIGKEFGGKRFYDILEREINVSVLRKRVEKILDTKKPYRDDLQNATLEMYAAMHDLKGKEEVEKHFHTTDEAMVARSRIRQLGQKYGEEILRRPKELQEMAHLVIRTPEVFATIPEDIKSYVEADSPFYAALAGNEETFVTLAEQANMRMRQGEEPSPEEAASIPISEHILDYIESVHYNLENLMQGTAPPPMEYEQMQQEYQKMQEERPAEEQMFLWVGDEEDRGYHPSEEEQQYTLYGPQVSTQGVPQQGINTGPMWGSANGIIQDINIDPNKETEKEPQEAQNPYPEDYRFTDDDFIELVHDWEATKVGAQMRLFPHEMQDALARIVAEKPMLYMELPVDMTNPMDKDNAPFYDRLETALKENDGEEVLPAMAQDLAIYQETHGEKEEEAPAKDQGQEEREDSDFLIEDRQQYGYGR